MNSCTNKESNTQNTLKEITSVFESYLNDINNGNISSIPKYFSDDPSFYWVEDGLQVYKNKQSMVESLEGFTANASEVSMETENLIITSLTNEIATLYVDYVQNIKFNSGFELNLDGAMTSVLRKEGTTWKFLSGHSSIQKERNN